MAYKESFELSKIELSKVDESIAKPGNDFRSLTEGF